nr:immunoglobulin heavy chain junction region [Macaca mulatta]MOY21253.1 immunoglobulin heavy chain junction region [Macaca mulatta]MOY23705.1 immunoglobulin heavy chain junction region [Macaca mulatta]MOY24309.1 immunoglobulin heavy chain junction region [Macaca mulatta]MOY24527.1 immunoglobulin heavy chain junction region [Macaca mulatta]
CVKAYPFYSGSFDYW